LFLKESNIYKGYYIEKKTTKKTSTFSPITKRRKIPYKQQKKENINKKTLLIKKPKP
jgi:hypothetical protein